MKITTCSDIYVIQFYVFHIMAMRTVSSIMKGLESKTNMFIYLKNLRQQFRRLFLDYDMIYIRHE